MKFRIRKEDFKEIRKDDSVYKIAGGFFWIVGAYLLGFKVGMSYCLATNCIRIISNLTIWFYLLTGILFYFFLGKSERRYH